MSSIFIVTISLVALQIAAIQDIQTDSRSAEQPVDVVIMRLAASGTLKGSFITVNARSGVVTLEGTVPTESAEARAVQITRQVRGVDRVEDRLRIAPPPAPGTPPPGDTQLARKVAETLLREVLAGRGQTHQRRIHGW